MTTFVISDTHFFHINIIKFCRHQFADPQEMNEVIVQKWNEIVRPNDTVYHVGDVAFGGGRSRKERLEEIMPRLNGKKKLCMGNHDHNPAIYAPYFDDVASSYELGIGTTNFFLCHYPIHFTEGDNHVGDTTLNIHGHIHTFLTGNPRHVNVCVEHTDYAPVPIEDIASGKFKNKRIV
jgi:calcineurin-like phosphoesterase family protein